MKDKNEVVKFSWFEKHFREICSLLYEKTITNEGLFLPWRDFRWDPIGRHYGTLVSQTRMIYNFAEAYKKNHEKKYLDEVKKGCRFLLDRFKDPKNGGYFYSCNVKGNIIDSRKDSYGHAFVIFGLSHAAKAAKNSEFKEEALKTWEFMKKVLRDEYGGLYTKLSCDFEVLEKRRSQNPIMHLFEALLALSELEGMDHILGEAVDVADFILDRLVRHKDHHLPEYYDKDWNELPEEQGGNLDVGHAFEWAYLLSYAVERGLPESYLWHAEKLLANGLAMGFDPKEGGIFSPASPDGNSVQKIKGWWEQCEAVRTMIHFAFVRNKDSLWDPLKKTIDFIQSSMIDHENKGWYTFLAEGMDHINQEKLTPGKVYYHTIGMCLEVFRHYGEENII